jgi:hypothetical protein
VLSAHGRFADAASVATRALALDSLARQAGNGPCGSCTFYDMVTSAALNAGDYARAEAAARRSVALEPQRPGAWSSLADVLAARRRPDDALAASRRAAALAPREPVYVPPVVLRLVEARRLDAADSAVRAWQMGGDAALAAEVLQLRAMILRERGRHIDAAHLVADALRGRRDSLGAMLLVGGNSAARTGDTVQASRLIEAAALHGIAATTSTEFPRDRARAFAWGHAQLADALYLADAADSARLGALADSVQSIGARSYLARDWRLHHHVRGLIAMRGRRWRDAEAEFQRARFGPAGWTRTVVELARAQLAQGETREAVATMRDAYAGPMDGMGRYAPRSEIDYWMATAFAAAGERDSARAYAGYAATAWPHADPSVRRPLARLAASLDVTMTPSRQAAR